MSNRNGYVTYNNSSFEGSEAGGGFYDDIKDRREQRQSTSFMLVLMGLMLVCVLATSVLLAKDVNYMINGTKQVAQYTENSHGASFVAPDGKTYIVNAYWTFPSGDTVNIYYLDNNYSKAVALMNPVVWIVCYGLFGGVFAFAIYVKIKSAHPKRHAVPRDPNKRDY